MNDGIVYKITDLETGQFYIGQTHRKRWNRGYPGSGTDWLKHIKDHPDKRYYPDNPNSHSYLREILHERINSIEELNKMELEEILKYCDYDDNLKIYKNNNPLFLNIKLSEQNELPRCSECGSIAAHLKTCSKFSLRKETTPCNECGRKNGHLKTCSQFKQSKACLECGGIRGHKKSCSRYNYKPCSECGVTHGHKKTCSKVKLNVKSCPECNGKDGKHFKTCSKYKYRICNECGCSSGHFKTCSKYTKRKTCSECGVVGGHKDTCSKSLGECLKCGYSLQSRKHAKDCSKHKS